MKRHSAAWPALAFFFLLAFWGCGGNNSSSDSDQPFSVKFTIASVPRNLSIDSLAVRFTLGDTGSPQTFNINLKTGISKSTIQAFPGQKYNLSYEIFAAGYKIGSGADSGTLTKDMSIVLSPNWDNGKVDQAVQTIHSGTYLPSYLGSAYNVAMAGKDLKIQIDSAQGKTYRWWVRSGDSIIAEGEGSLIDWTPPDSLAGSKVSIKVHVLDGNTIVEEKIWDVQIISSLPYNRIVGIVTKNDTTSAAGTFTYYKYTAEGNRDSILIFDTTAFIASRTAISSIAYSYPSGTTGKANPTKAVAAFENDPEIDSTFTYDLTGLLRVVTVSSKSDNTVDSIFHGPDSSLITRSYAKGVLTQVIRHVRKSDSLSVDSIFSDTGSQAAKVIEYTYSSSRLMATKTYVNRGGLTPNQSERFVYNGLGALAFHFTYSEGAVLELLQTEACIYNAAGSLAEILVNEDDTGDLMMAQYFQYEATGKASAKVSAAQIENRQWVMKLNKLGRLSRRDKITPRFPVPSLFLTGVGP